MIRVMTLLGLAGASLLMLYLDGRLPEWLLKGEVLVVSTFALIFGYGVFRPAPPAWLKYQEVRGMACVYLGVAAMFIPAQFIVSACLIGVGTRLIMTSNQVTVRVAPGTPLGRGDGEIVIREKGTLAR